MNWKAPKVKTAPALEPSTAAELKTLLGIDSTETSFDTMLAAFITAARVGVEGHCKRSLITQTLTRSFRSFPSPCGSLELLLPPVQSITAITYLDEDGATKTLAASAYVVDLEEPFPRIFLAPDQEWPETYDVPNAVTVEYVAGYGAAAINVPAPLRVCVNSIAADLFEHREAHVEVSNLVESPSYKFLLSQYVIPGVA